MVANKGIITGLDVGTSTIRIVMGQQLPDGRLKIIGAAETPAEGITRGSISSIEDAVSCISETIEKAERMTGQRIDKMIIGMSGSHIKTVNSKGVVAVAKANEQVDDSDTERAIDVAESTTTMPNYEVLHVLPISYNLDDQKDIKEPQGMSGVRLEVETQVILSLSSQAKNLTKCIYRTGVDTEVVVFSILATCEAVLSAKQKELGVVVVDIGTSTTLLAVYEEGNILHTAVLPIGHITNDLAIGLKTSIETAEAVKIDQASALAETVSKREEVDLHKYSEDEPKGSFVYKREVAEIAEARMEEIFSMVNDELKKIDRDGKLPAGVVLTGGGAKLPNIVELAKQVFQLPLVMWFDKNLDSSGRFLDNMPSITQTTDKMKTWFKSLWPS